jgi:hypothetical protein
MPINTGASIYAGLFDKGDRVKMALSNGKGSSQGSWIQVVHGRVSVAGVTLDDGDGVGITGVSELDFSFEENTEALLFDLDMSSKLLWQ